MRLRSLWLVYFLSVAVTVAESALRSGYLFSQWIDGFQLSTLLGSAIFFLFAYYILYKNDICARDYKILTVMILGNLSITLPVRVADFIGTLDSLPVTLSHLAAMLFAYYAFESRYKRGLKYFIIADFAVFVLVVTFPFMNWWLFGDLRMLHRLHRIMQIPLLWNLDLTDIFVLAVSLLALVQHKVEEEQGYLHFIPRKFIPVWTVLLLILQITGIISLHFIVVLVLVLVGAVWTNCQDVRKYFRGVDFDAYSCSDPMGCRFFMHIAPKDDTCKYSNEKQEHTFISVLKVLGIAAAITRTVISSDILLYCFILVAVLSVIKIVLDNIRKNGRAIPLNVALIIYSGVINFLLGYVCVYYVIWLFSFNFFPALFILIFTSVFFIWPLLSVKSETMTEKFTKKTPPPTQPYIGGYNSVPEIEKQPSPKSIPSSYIAGMRRDASGIYSYNSDSHTSGYKSSGYRNSSSRSEYNRSESTEYRDKKRKENAELQNSRLRDNERRGSEIRVRISDLERDADYYNSRLYHTKFSDMPSQAEIDRCEYEIAKAEREIARLTRELNDIPNY